jgi:hypothetical protein
MKGRGPSWYPLCSKEGMILSLGILATAAAGSLFAVFNGLRHAPEGYEDEQGFHVLRKRVRGSGVSRRQRSGQPLVSLTAKEIRS